MGCLCTNGYPLAASAITHGLLLVVHGLLQLQKQPMGDQFQCSRSHLCNAFVSVLFLLGVPMGEMFLSREEANWAGVHRPDEAGSRRPHGANTIPDKTVLS